MAKPPLYAVNAAALARVTAITLGLLATPPAAWAQIPAQCAECITLVVEPGQALALARPLNRLAVVVRVPVAAEPVALPALTAIRDAGGLPGLLITGAPSSSLNDEVLPLLSWIFYDIAALASSSDDDMAQLAFRLKTRSTEMRAAAPTVQLGLVATRAQVALLRQLDVAPYLDVIAERVEHGTRASAWHTGGEAYAVVRPAAEQGAGTSADSSRWLWRAPPDVVEASALAGDLSRSMRMLVADLVPGGLAEIFCDGRAAISYLNPMTLETIAVATSCGSGVITLSPSGPIVERVRLSNGDVIVRVPSIEGRFVDDVQVTGTRELTVQEIIARHQAAVARQRARIQTLISAGSMTLTFEAPGFPAPMTINSEAVIYDGLGRTEIEQRSVRVNGIEFGGSGVPRLPIIEPERVASPPLAITLSHVYRYALAGRDRVGSTPCYVVAFEPVDARRPLFRGRAWIAADTFAMRRVVAAQTGLRGPIVSSEQIDEFTQYQNEFWLLSRSEVRQIYEGAGHRTPIHRVLAIATHEVNPADFSTRRSSAHQSSGVMLRDTPEGYRYLRRENTGEASNAAERVVAAAAHRVRTLALGVIIDPNISRPLPFAGLSYVDFNLFGTGTQLTAFFGGTYGQLAFSVPSLGGSRWQLAGRAFGIASSYNDRAFSSGREIYERNVTQRPAHASIWALRPLTPRVTVRAGYDLDYTQFGASKTTSPAFSVPADQVAHSARVAVEGQYAGWTAGLWWAPSRRSGWQPWGAGVQDYVPQHADYQRYGANLTRPFVVNPALVARIEAAVMAGRHLDRFSRYAFGTFDNRLRGYPSALIRYDRGGVIRMAAAWTAGRRFRLDGFLDSAYVHDPGFGAGLKDYTGVGAAAEVPAPFGMLAAVEWGYGFQGVKASGRRGTQVVRVSAFKIF